MLYIEIDIIYIYVLYNIIYDKIEIGFVWI
jgi:hypothetical protein